VLLIACTQKKPVSNYLLSVRKFEFLASLRFNEDGFIFSLLEEATVGCQTDGRTAKGKELCVVWTLHYNHIYLDCGFGL
jgi:hypothetical protein